MLKHPKTIKEQVSLLKKRGIIIDDISNVESTLINNNYYRIMGYALQFRIGKEDYIKNIKFSTIVKIYNFDRSLRQIIFPLLEVFETSFRAKLAYFMCVKYKNEEFYLDINIFKDAELYFYFIGTISRCIKQSKNELFVKHHLKNYNGRFPFWVLVEILSFSNISKCFKNINTADKKEFLKSYYNYGVKFFENWIENISIVRNIIAHHGRLYNKNINPSLKLLEEDNFNRTRKIFDLIFILKKVIFDKYLWSDFLEKINFLINTYKNDIDFELIGFPKNYMEILEK